ncbi:hypothetical protein EBR96_05105, partial [bacterium]|nr:hypothetical protein [bacterium]
NSGDVFEAIYEVAGVGVSTAIKCIKTGFGGETASRVIERLSREKEITSSVSGCPNIISTMGMGYYLGTDEDPFHETASGDLGLRIHPFLLMELGNGTLKIPRPKSPSPIGGFSFEDSIPLMLQMIDAGIALSDAGVVHRDMKPANFVWVGSQIKLADFGLAISKVPRSSGSEVISVTGTHEGTFPYMPPEALGISMESGQSGRSLWNDRSDVFSMGCIFFELLTGRPYVPARKLEGAIQIHMDGKLWQSARRLLRQKSVAPELMDRYKLVCTWIGRMVANDPRDRPTFEQVKVGFRSLVVRSEPV